MEAASPDLEKQGFFRSFIYREYNTAGRNVRTKVLSKNNLSSPLILP
jgi:hypothetical protein